MNYNPPKEVDFKCSKCSTINHAKIHFNNAILYQKCIKCSKDNKIEFLKGEIIETLIVYK